jgi:NADH:ubiquinone oxidoreductase subunit 3 (subunit A)
MLWIGILIGIFLGANVGFFFIAMCISAKKGDKLKKVAYD